MSSAQNPDADREDYVVSVLEFAGDPGAATAALQRVFGLGEVEARNILGQVPVEVRRSVNRIRAEYFRRALELSGARVEVRDGDGAVVTAAAARAPTSPIARPRAQPASSTLSQPQPSAADRSKEISQTVTFGSPSSPANDAARSSGGGWGDLERLKPAGKHTAAKPAAPDHAAQPKTAPPDARPSAVDAPKSAARTASSAEDQFVLSLGDEAGPLDSPLTAALEGGALELASIRPANRARPVNEGRAIELESDSAPPGPGLELALDADDPEASRLREVMASEKRKAAAKLGGPLSGPLGGARNSGPEAPKADPVTGTRPRNPARPASVDLKPTAQRRAPSGDLGANAQASVEAGGLRANARAPEASEIRGVDARAGDLPKTHARPVSQDLNAAAPRARAPSGDLNFKPGAASSELHLKAGAPSDLHLKAGSALDAGRVSGDSARRDADASQGRLSTEGRSAATRGQTGQTPTRSRGRGASLGFWEAALLGFSGTSVSWIAKIAGATVVLAGLAQLSVLWPGVGVPLLLIGLTCLLGLCSEYHRHVFWAAATRESELNQRPALSVVNMMRDGFHLAALAVISQALLWFWLSGQLREGHRPIAIVFSPTPWVLGFGPGFYWPIALACAAARNQAAGVWNFALGLRALGRAPGDIALVVLTTAVAFLISWMIMAAVISPTSLDPTLALVTAVGLPIAISHALAGALMGRAVHDRPDLFE